MLNQVIMVGRLTQDPTIKELENEKKICNMTLAIPRSYKNIDGIYENDYVDCVIYNMIAKNTKEYCKKGDLVGIKGRIETKEYEENGENKKITQIVAEKVTFLSNGKEREVK